MALRILGNFKTSVPSGLVSRAISLRLFSQSTRPSFDIPSFPHIEEPKPKKKKVAKKVDVVPAEEDYICVDQLTETDKAAISLAASAGMYPELKETHASFDPVKTIPERESWKRNI